MVNTRQSATEKLIADGWFQDNSGHWRREESATVGKDGRDLPSQPPPSIRGDVNTTELQPYEPKFLDNQDIREHPIGIPESQPLTDAQQKYRSYMSKQKHQAEMEANAAMAMKAILGMNEYEKRDYLRKHDLREKRLPSGKSIIVPDEERQRVLMLRERQRVMAEIQAKQSQERAKRATSDNININQLTRAAELLMPEEQERLLVGLLGPQRLAALEAIAKQQEQTS